MTKVRTPFERNRATRKPSNAPINILIIIVLTLLWATIYLSRGSISWQIWNNNTEQNSQWGSSMLGSIWSSISLNGDISLSTDSSKEYTHLLNIWTTQIGIKSSTIMLDSYTGTIEIIGTIELDQDGIWIVEVTQVTNGTIDWIQDDTMTGDDSLDELTGDVMTWSLDDIENTDPENETSESNASTTNTDTNNTTSQLIEDRSVTQFRINTGKTLAYEGNRGFDIVFPTQNIAYEASNIGTWLEYGNNLRCSVRTNIIVFRDQDLINESPSVEIYECSARRGFSLSSIRGYRIISGDTESKVFLVKANDPAWVRFANNIEVLYRDNIETTESSSISNTSSSTNSDISRSIE